VVDLKIVEMQGFNTLPHMLILVLTDPNKVPNLPKLAFATLPISMQTF
jgi:DNA segregation ATPase FtsK/SpoIIIE-like protein